MGGGNFFRAEAVFREGRRHWSGDAPSNIYNIARTRGKRSNPNTLSNKKNSALRVKKGQDISNL